MLINIMQKDECMEICARLIWQPYWWLRLKPSVCIHTHQGLVFFWFRELTRGLCSPTWHHNGSTWPYPKIPRETKSSSPKTGSNRSQIEGKRRFNPWRDRVAEGRERDGEATGHSTTCLPAKREADTSLTWLTSMALKSHWPLTNINSLPSRIHLLWYLTLLKQDKPYSSIVGDNRHLEMLFVQSIKSSKIKKPSEGHNSPHVFNIHNNSH